MILGRKKNMKKKKKTTKRKTSEKTKKKRSESIAKAISEGKLVPPKNNKVVKTRYSTKSWYHSEKNNDDFYSDSIAEALKMTMLDANPIVKRWTKKHGIRIPYIYRNKSHYTIPDFLIELQDGTLIIEEVKGKITPKELAKKDATEKYCQIYGYKYIFTTTTDLDINGQYTAYLAWFKNKNKLFK